MKAIDKTKPVLVTGATGYIASWVVKYLLDEGIDVHATVRSTANKEKYAHLTKIAENAKGKLSFFEADLLKEGSFEEAMKGCELVMHMASPFFITGIKDAQKELVTPALEGTRNVLTSVNKTETVKRVVLTSSIAAVMGDAIDIKKTENNIFTEEHWNTTSSVDHQPYPYSKTIAEKEAWKINKIQNRWDLLTINPGFVLGPSLSQRTDSTSIDFMIKLGDGTFKSGVPGGLHAMVDVRDVAISHLKAGFTPEASGRHLLVSESSSFVYTAKVLKQNFPGYSFPRMAVPKWLFMIIGPGFGYNRNYIRKNIGIDEYFDNSYTKKDLGINFRPIEETYVDHFQQLVDDRLVKR